MIRPAGIFIWQGELFYMFSQYRYISRQEMYRYWFVSIKVC